MATAVLELRIVLLGNNLSDTSNAGNLILGRNAFETEAPPHSVDQNIEKARGWVDNRNITIINVPHLYDSEHTHLTEKIKECVSLSAPGPHAFLLLVEPQSFTDEDKNQLKHLLKCFSDRALDYSILISKGKKANKTKSECFKSFWEECGGRFHKIKNSKTSNGLLLEKIDELIKINGHHLTCEISEDTNDFVPHFKHEKDKAKEKRENAYWPEEQSQSTITTVVSANKAVSEGVTSLPVLNLVLCGHDESLKASVSKILLPQREPRSDIRSMCITRTGIVDGYQLTLVEIPALYNTHLSEEVICKTVHSAFSPGLCCNPGVHAFFIIISEDNFTDEDKAEIEMIQKHFSYRIHNHTIFLINQQFLQMTTVDQAVIKSWGGQYISFSDKTHTLDLLQCVEKLLQENRQSHFTMSMYIEAQFEIQLGYNRKIKTLQQKISELEKNINQTQDSLKSPDTVRIVLLGKTGVGKSATGNTILGNEIFIEKLSSKSVTTFCQKETCEINGRLIAVIDTPGLFATKISNIETQKEITKCISMAAPGPHVFLLVLRIGQRFTQEEQDAVKIIKETFGEESRMFTMVLFTGGDQLKNKTIEQYIDDSDSDLTQLLFEFGRRHHVFNNKDRNSNMQVCDLLNKIDKVNKGSCYTNEMFQKVEKAIKENQERILEEKKEQIEQEKEELKSKYEAEMEKIKKEMQEQKEQQEAESRRKEENFKIREEQIKKDLTEREQIMREDFRKRKEEDDLMMNKWIEEINREREENRKQWEKQREDDQKLRDHEEEKRKKREQEWEEKKREEKEKFEREKNELKKNEAEALKKLQQEYQQKAAEEEKKINDLEEKIKHAEESKKKELMEQLSQLQESEKRLKEEEKRRNEQQKNWEMKIQQMEEVWNSEQEEKQKQYEKEKLDEKEERERKEKERKEIEEQEKKRIENDANEKIQKMKEEMEAERLTAEQARKEMDEQHRQEMEKKLHEQQEDFKQEKENKEQKHNEAEQKKIDFIKDQHNREMKKLKKKTEQETRKQAEEEFNAKLDEKVKEAKDSGFEEGCEKVESERTRPGREVDALVNWVCGLKKDKQV